MNVIDLRYIKMVVQKIVLPKSIYLRYRAECCISTSRYSSKESCIYLQSAHNAPRSLPILTGGNLRVVAGRESRDQRITWPRS